MGCELSLQREFKNREDREGRGRETEKATRLLPKSPIRAALRLQRRRLSCPPNCGALVCSSQFSLSRAAPRRLVRIAPAPAGKIIVLEQARIEMEPFSQPRPAMGVAAGGSQVYPASAYPPAATIAAAPAVAPSGSQPVAPFPANPAQMSSQHQLVYQQAQQFHQQLQQQQQRQLQQFWAERLADIEQTTDFKNHSLPLARIKKIMKADEDVRMISAEAPVVFAKACEIFILELTLRSWMHTEENKRRTLQKNDIAAAITRTDIYDFLVDIVPRDDMKEEGVGLPRSGVPPIGGPSDAYPYYYMPQQQMAGAGMVYGGQQGHPVTYTWQEPHEQQEQQAAEEQRSLHESG